MARRDKKQQSDFRNSGDENNGKFNDTDEPVEHLSPKRETDSTAKIEQLNEASKTDTIYSMPPLYDLAFGYRSYEDEVDFLIYVHDKFSNNLDGEVENAKKDDRNFANVKSLRILELAAGPARHSIAALTEYPPSAVNSVVALDRSTAMVKYGSENADHDLGDKRRSDFTYLCGDMRDIKTSLKRENPEHESELFDTTWLLLGSMQHLLTNDDILACFFSVGSVMRDGGTVVIELPHPRETFSMGECTRNGWTVPLVESDGEDGGDEKEYGELNIIWGEEDDVFDPVAQIRLFTVGMELKVNDPNGLPSASPVLHDQNFPLLAKMNEEGKISVSEIVPMRLFTLQEIDALARCAGFEVVAKFGALDEEVSIEDEDEAFRMVCVLKKVDINT